jgi:holo-[acyl-carrier protein] synthase
MLRMMDRRRQKTEVGKVDFQLPTSPSDWAVGVDCEQISRFENLSKSAKKRIFTEREMEYCSKKARPEQHFASRFAAKEAVVKCFGSLGKRIDFRCIEIVKCENGSPAARILDGKLKGYDVRISLSHSGDMAIAFAVMAKGDGGHE